MEGTMSILGYNGYAIEGEGGVNVRMNEGTYEFHV
jgi:hypothetical protein